MLFRIKGNLSMTMEVEAETKEEAEELAEDIFRDEFGVTPDTLSLVDTLPTPP